MFGQTKININTQTKGILAVPRGGSGTTTPGLIAGTNISITGSWPNQTVSSTGAANAMSLTPSGDQNLITGFNTNIMDIPFASFSPLVQGFKDEMHNFGEFPITWIGRANNPAAIWLFDDRDGSDPVQATMYLTSFVTNNVNRSNSQQGLALSVQSRGDGTGNFGFLNPVALNSQWRGSGNLHQTIDLFVAIPQNIGTGHIDDQIGISIQNHAHTAGGHQGIGLFVVSTGSAATNDWALFTPIGDNWLGVGNTYARRITLGCAATVQICTDDFTSLDTQPNGTMKYCTNCTVAIPASCSNITNTAACTCSAGGTGAIAKRINGVWLCN